MRRDAPHRGPVLTRRGPVSRTGRGAPHRGTGPDPTRSGVAHRAGRAAFSLPLASVGARYPLREQAIGFLVAVHLLTGRWSPARVFDLEPSMTYEPRVWATAGLVLLAMLPPPPVRRTPAPPGGLAVVTWQIAYLGFAVLSVGWAPDFDGAVDEAGNAILMLTTIVSLYRLCRTVDAAALGEAIWRALTVLLAAMAGIAILGGLGSSRLAVLGGGPNVFGRNMGVLCVIGLSRAIGGRAGWPWALAATVAAALVVLSGSRGAMVATAAAIASLLFMGRRGLSRRLLVLGVFVTVGLLVVGYTELGASVVESFSERVLQLLVREGYVSGRDRIFATAVDLGSRRPLLGHGVGSFRVMTPWPYAHNIFLDAFVETGAVGLGLLAGAMGHGAWVLLRSRARQVSPAAAAFVLLLVASQFSGGLYDSRGVYVFLLLVIVLEPRAHALRQEPRSRP